MAGREEHARFQAFGSTAVVGVTDLRRMAAARAAVTEVVEAFDLACSRFRDDSELSMVNAADGEAVPVSPLLIEAVAASLRAARLTDGDVDPTVGEALMALGYDRDYALVGAAEPPRIQIVAVPGWRTIKLDAEAGTIRLARGVRLDLGATAKALAADRAAEAARRAAGCGVLVSFGGDIAVSGPPPNGGWRVRVTDDHRSDDRCSRSVDHARVRRTGHLEHDRAHVGDRRRLRASPGRSGHGPARAWHLADRERGRGDLPGCEHRQHGFDHPRRSRPRRGFSRCGCRAAS